MQEGVQGNVTGDEMCQNTGGVMRKTGEEMREAAVGELGTNTG